MSGAGIELGMASAEAIVARVTTPDEAIRMLAAAGGRDVILVAERGAFDWRGVAAHGAVLRVDVGHDVVFARSSVMAGVLAGFEVRLAEKDTAIGELRSKFTGMWNREKRSREQAEKLAQELRNLKKSLPYRLSLLLLWPVRTVLKARGGKAGRGKRGNKIIGTGRDAQKQAALAAALREARAAYYQRGAVYEPLQFLRSRAKDMALPPEEARFLSILEGLERLETGFMVPRRQPDPGYLPRRGSVLYVLHASLPRATNGYSTRSHGIAGGVRAAGIDLAAVTRVGFPGDQRQGSPCPVLRSVCTIDGVDYVSTGGPSLNETPLDEYIAINADMILRECRSRRAEIVHAASNHIVGLSALLAARRLGIPFLYEVRGLWEMTQASVAEGWGESDRYRIAERLETLVACEADHVVALTDELKAELIRRGVAADRISVVPNCVDSEVFRPIPRDEEMAEELSLEADVPCIGFAGSVVAYEGLELLIDALAILSGREVRYLLLVVGDGRELANLKRYAQQKGVADNCRFVGRVPFAEVNRYISLMDVMPCPRLAMPVTEMVSPLKPLEAMSAGKAVVLSDVSPHLVFAGDGDRAALFRKGDADHLAAVLEGLLGNPARRAEVGAAARAWVVENRTWAHAGRSIAAAYENLLAKRHIASGERSGRRLDQMSIGLIADRFTRDAFSGACRVTHLTPDGWVEELQENKLDALIVESAWQGLDGAWHQRVGFYGDEKFAPLAALIEHCRKHGIPTIFWNKEDPVHFERFKIAAALCDHVFTSDANCIDRYLALPGRKCRTVSSLPFFAAPKLHNPLPGNRPWNHTICYGGTYYGNRYEERTQSLKPILLAATAFGLTIYDRQHTDQASPYKFPPALAPFVEGGLDYADMVAAYKAHPIQVNVNSVIRSPTMFSRRVPEAAACGAVLVSGPGEGMVQEMQSVVRVAHTEAEACKHFNELLSNEATRFRVAWNGLREVMRRHTVGHRLAQMLRTAGGAVGAPRLPEPVLLAPALDGDGAAALLRQTLPPTAVFVAEASDDVLRILRDARINVGPLSEWREGSPGAWALVLRDPAGAKDLPETAIEDLLVATWWADRPLIGSRQLRPDELAPGAGRNLAGYEPPTSDLILLAADDERVGAVLRDLTPSSWGSRMADLVTEVPGVTLRYAPAPQASPEACRTVVVAGHDLKFLAPILPAFDDKGARVLIDHWEGHSKNDEQRSLWLRDRADVVFCEWCLGNAVWYSRNKRPGQRLVARLHAQEVRSPLLERVDFDAFDRVIFVGPHIRDEVVARTRLNPARTEVVPNAVDTAALNRPKQGDFRHALGLVGIVPQMKRLDLALDILERLLAEDQRFRLYVKGRRPEEYPWMANRPAEIAWYQAQFARIAASPSLAAAVQFDPHGADMPEWYRKIGFPLSVSDHESFHLTVADGAASGGNPVILPWHGADRLYLSDWIVPDVEAAAARILQLSADEKAFAAGGEAARRFAHEHFARDKVAMAVVDIVLDAVVGGSCEP